MTQSIPGVAIFVAKPGAEAEVEEALKSLVGPSRTESGVVHYTLHKDRENPRRFVFTEEWKDQAAFDEHFVSAHVVKVFPAINEQLESFQILLLTEIGA
jgi:quinol monooxygenase YgiN